MHALMGVRILVSIVDLRKRRVSRDDVKPEFFQSGAAAQSVYVVPPRESANRFRYF